MSVALVSFTQRASAGSQAVTGVGFQPKAVILWTTWKAGTGLFDGAEICEGAGDGTKQFARSMRVYPALAGWSEGFTYASILRRIDDGSAEVCEASLSSLDSDGFTLSWSASDAGGATVYAIAFGGSSLQAALLTGTIPSSATTAITGAGFTPTAALVWAAPTGTPTTTGHVFTARHSWGFAAGGNQCSCATLEIAAFGNVKRTMSTVTDAIVATTMQESGIIAGGATSHHKIDSFGTDGVSFSDALGSYGGTADVAVLCLRGVSIAVGEVIIPTSPGTVAETTGFEPELLLLQTVDRHLGGSSITSDARFGVGAWTAGAQATIGAGRDATGMVTAAHTDTAIRIYQPAASYGSSTLRIAATVDSIQTDGFTLDVTTVTGDGDFIQYLAFGPTDVPPSSRNLLTGSTHTVQGSDNLIVGASGTVTGDKNALFNLSETPDSLTADHTFKVVADDTIDLVAGTLLLNGVDASTLATHTGALTSGKTVIGNGASDITIGSLTATVVKSASGALSAASAGTDYTDAAFKTIAVSGQSDVVADTPADTLTLVAGTNVTLTTNAGTDTITIAATGGGGSGTVTNTGTLTSGKTIVGNGGVDVTASSLTANLVASSSGTLAGATAAANSKLLGSGASGSGSAYAELSLGTGLTMTGTTLSASGGASSGWVLLESHTASSSASLNFTTRNASAQSGATFQSDYDAYRIEFVALVNATNSQDGWMRVTTDGGSTWDSSGNYYWAYRYIGNNGANSISNASGSTKVNLSEVQDNTKPGVSGTVKLSNPLSGSLTKTGQMDMLWQQSSIYYQSTGVFVWNVTTAVNGFQFLFSSGNITSGTIMVYGLSK